ncbi:tRNA lysidine(34) synthetase TilS [Pseudorhodobacter turbinis]|uniref:tRNA(Ile)-lysidine synthase n=1 Tax=Pseudorhodobacter turbinis TaxID=2500533 RepID=A0A4P8EDV5_9RHOB|nr:tRNA lysidine(34) synthetase TilS [Pseudorhodobacter turbinis]QCO55181.1 tRNA lysidine(34) synthetase TilS [Pseudorhodobacter turbinis]
MPVKDWAESDLIAEASAAVAAAPDARVAVAVSGGSDSMASLHLAWQAFGAVQAVTVDHALRAGSAEEAHEVSRFCEDLGVGHQTLVWQHGTVTGNLMEAARQARYGLMADWAESAGITHIFLGHTADDQAETFLMGLARGAGIDGLSGMRAEWQHGAVRFVRPFLAVPRATLRSYLTTKGIAWVDDPSNENERFTRVKTRKLLPQLQPLGITVERLAGVISNLAATQSVVRQAVADAAVVVCHEVAGSLEFDLTAWSECSPEIQRRLLLAGILWVSGAEHAPRAAATARVLQAIAARRDATLWGVRLRMGPQSFRLMREARAVGGACGPNALWDGRWQVTGPFAAGQQLQGLGADGLRQVEGWRETGIARDVLLVSPSVWQDDVLVAAPLAGFSPDFHARIAAAFNQFVVSH